jgi:MFS family permease
VRRSASLYRAALADRNVALLIGAGFASEIGDWFSTVALISLSYDLSASVAGVGSMLAIRMGARLLLQGPAGALVDRFQGRRLLFASQIAMGVVATAFALLLWFPSLWLLLALVVLLEAINCVARPAFMVELRLESPEELRAAALGTLYASATTAQLIGPALGAVALLPLGPFAVFVLNGLTFFGVALAVAAMKGDLRHKATTPAAPEMPDESNQPAGYRWLLRYRDLVSYSLVSLSLALLVQATITLFILKSHAFGFENSGVGIFYTAVAIGSVTGSVVAGGLNQNTLTLFPAAVAMTFCGISLAVFGAANALVIALIFLVIAGFATDFYEVVGLSFFQHAIPEEVYGRFFSVFLLALSTGGLIGALAAPLLEPRVGVERTLIALALPSVILAILFGWQSRFARGPRSESR